MSAVDDLVAWLRQQLDDDERTARRVAPNQAPIEVRAMVTREGSEPFLVVDSALLLAQVDATRRIITEVVDEATSLDMSVDLDRRVGSRDTAVEPYLGDVLLRLLALPYADRPGYREEWRP